MRPCLACDPQANLSLLHHLCRYVNLLHDGASPADAWVDQTAEDVKAQDATSGTTVELFSVSGKPDFGISTEGCASEQAICSGTTNPGSGRRAHFTITCGDESYFGTDLYYFAPADDDFGNAAAKRPYRCQNIVPDQGPAYELPMTDSGQLEIRPTGVWTFSQGHTNNAGGKYAVFVRVVSTVTVSTGSTANYIVDNGVGGTFRLQGLLHWACEYPIALSCLSDYTHQPDLATVCEYVFGGSRGRGGGFSFLGGFFCCIPLFSLQGMATPCTLTSTTVTLPMTSRPLSRWDPLETGTR